jgi:hypothetical protein
MLFAVQVCSWWKGREVISMTTEALLSEADRSLRREAQDFVAADPGRLMWKAQLAVGRARRMRNTHGGSRRNFLNSRGSGPI